MTTTVERAVRSERLYVRLTADEAAYVTDLADARGLTVSDFVRATVLRRTGLRPLVGRRALAAETAATIRQLSLVAAELRRIVEIAQAKGGIRQDEVNACLLQVRAAIAACGP
jgi:hypothetical protein